MSTETRYPRIILSATKSGSGKTLITCALLEALKRRTLEVSAFKCGPDYIDPMFHRKVLDIPSRNLDLYFTDENTTRALFMKDNEADISVIEGVMGLYDGLGGVSEEASAYHLARTLKAPVILIIDARGMGRSILAEIAGFLSMDREKLIAGVILNRMSGMFYPAIKAEIEKSFDIEVLGYFPVNSKLHLDSRYLGLKLPQEIENLREMAVTAAEALEETVDIDRIIKLAESAKSLEAESPLWLNENYWQKFSDRKKKIAVAYDRAFCFYYEDNFRILRNMGAELEFFSPIRDEKLPDHIDGILLGGGYPELLARELSANETMKESIRNAVARGIPVLAECGGFMYLNQSIITEDGSSWDMVGLIPGECRYVGKLVRFGYIGLESQSSELLREGEEIRGHEFHYFDSDNNGRICLAKKPTGKRNWQCIHNINGGLVGYPHLYYASRPEFVERLLWKRKSLK